MSGVNNPTTTNGDSTQSYASYVLFHSDQCQHCVKLLQLLNRNQMTDMFELVDVMLKSVPTAISSVPTVYEKNTSKLHVGQEVFELVEEMSKHNIVSYEFGGIGSTSSDRGISFSDVDFGKTERSCTFSYI